MVFPWFVRPFATEAAGHNISGAAQTVLMRSIPRPGCSFRGKAYRDPQVKAPNGGYVDTAEMCQETDMGYGRLDIWGRCLDILYIYICIIHIITIYHYYDDYYYY